MIKIPETGVKSLSEFSLPLSVYRMARRPGHLQLVVNNGYQGIALLDIQTGKIFSTFNFPPGYGPDGVVSAILLRSDGREAFALNQESGMGCIFDLENKQSPIIVKLPLFKAIYDLRYLWNTDIFWLTGAGSPTNFQLKKDASLIFDRGNPRELTAGYLPFARALNKIPWKGCNVIRTEPEKNQMLYHLYSESPSKIGVINWGSGSSWSFEIDGPVPDFVADISRVFILGEFEIREFSFKGLKRREFKSGNGFHFSNLELFPRSQVNQPLLVTVSHPLSGKEGSRISVYELD